jgi:Tol biopolymer transport system component
VKGARLPRSLIVGLCFLGVVGGARSAARTIPATLLFDRSPGDDCLQDLYSIRADGSGLRPLTTDSKFRHGDFPHLPFTASFGGGWSPDGRRIVYTRERAVGDCAHLDTRDDVFMMRADGSGVRRLTTDGKSGGAQFSPDGTKLAFDSGSSIVLSDTQAQHRRVLGIGYSPEWSSDGSRLSYGCGPSGVNLCVLDLKTRQKRRLGSRGGIYTPAWTSDGGTILFARYHHGDTAGETELWSMRWDGSNRRQLTNQGKGRVRDECPAESPSGNEIAFTRSSDSVDSLALLDVHGVSSLLRASSLGCPAWSPDGSLIAIEREGSLWIVGSSGSGVRRLTKGRWSDSIDAWRP